MTPTALASTEVVTADEHPGLFWAVHGGGDGVVASCEFGPHPVDLVVQHRPFFWSLDQGPAAPRLAREITPAASGGEHFPAASRGAQEVCQGGASWLREPGLMVCGTAVTASPPDRALSALAGSR